MSYWDQQQQYYLAACKRGHVREHQLRDPDDESIEKFCTTCGAPVITRCGKCQSPLLGSSRTSIMIVTPTTRADAFCRACGVPMPWASREERIAHLQNLLDFEDLQNAEQLEIIEQLAVMSQPIDSADDDQVVAAGERIRSLAPAFWEAAKPVLTSLLTEAVKRRLGW